MMTLEVQTSHTLRDQKWVRIPTPISGNKSWRRTVRLQFRGPESCAVFWPLFLAPRWVQKWDSGQAPCGCCAEACSAPQCTLVSGRTLASVASVLRGVPVQELCCFVTSVCYYGGPEQRRRGTRLRAQLPPLNACPRKFRHVLSPTVTGQFASHLGGTRLAQAVQADLVLGAGAGSGQALVLCHCRLRAPREQ